MTTTPASGSGQSQPSTKRTIKRKLDETILKKARDALGLSVLAPEDDGKPDEPSLKWRKPRHNTEEGQIYIKNKEKRKRLEEQSLGIKPKAKISSSSPGKADDKKKRKKKKKKKVKGQQNKTEPAPTLAKDPEGEKRHGMEAIAYLQLWATNRDHWKFEKRKQTWLLKNCLNSDLIDDTRFETLLDYVGSIKGAARQTTLTEMQTLVTKYELSGGSKKSKGKGDDHDDDDNTKSDEKFDLKSITPIMYDRARQIVQVLVDD